jgi:N-acetylneuraminic acid mutarotase
VGDGELVLFGGFGGEGNDGKYLNDVWSFSLKDYEWTEIATTGDLP